MPVLMTCTSGSVRRQQGQLPLSWDDCYWLQHCCGECALDPGYRTHGLCMSLHEQRAWISVWGMLTPSFGNEEVCRHLPLLDGACLYPFTAMGALSLCYLKKQPQAVVQQKGRWGKSQPACLQWRLGRTTLSNSAFPCSTCIPHCLCFSFAAPLPRMSYPREQPPSLSQASAHGLSKRFPEIPHCIMQAGDGGGSGLLPLLHGGALGLSEHGCWCAMGSSDPVAEESKPCLMHCTAATQHPHHAVS